MTSLFGCWFLLAQSEEKPILTDIVRAALAEQLPVNPGAVPEFATFYMLKDYEEFGDAPPYPFNPWPSSPVYAFGGDDVFLVDNTVMSAGKQQLGTVFWMDGEIEPPPEEPGETNPPAITWPVSLEELTLLAPQDVPEFGTFYLYQDQVNGEEPPPYPFNPCSLCPVYSLGIEGQYLVDDRGVIWSEPEPGPLYAPLSYEPGTLWLEITNLSNGILDVILHGTEPGTNYTIESQQTLAGTWISEQVITGAVGQTSTTFSVAVGYRTAGLLLRARVGVDAAFGGLWLEMTGVAAGYVSVNIHNTSSEDVYEILSRESLGAGGWNSEGTVPGIDGVTPTLVPTLSRPNLFLMARNLTLDSLGQGLPDWWQNAYFGYLGVDPYADPDGDGWSNIEEYWNGTNPGQPNIPPPPRGLSARWDVTGNLVTLTWESGGGPVQYYTIEEDGDFEVAQVSSSTFSFATSPSLGQYTMLWLDPGFTVTAHFAGGGQSQSQLVRATRTSLASGLSITRGPQGRAYLAVASPGPDLSHVSVSYILYGGALMSTNVYATNLLNGLAPIPQIPGLDYHPISLRAFGTNGNVGPPISSFLVYTAEESMDETFHFTDAGRHLKENLNFLLRSATATLPFSYSATHPVSGVEFARPPTSVDYEYYGFHSFDTNCNYAPMFSYGPIQENYFWRNFVNETLNFNVSGDFVTGASSFDWPSTDRELHDPLWLYEGDGTETPLPLVLGSANNTWTYFSSRRDLGESIWGTALAEEIGVSTDGGGLVFDGGIRNCYGLLLNSLRAGLSSDVPPGSTIDDSPVFLDYETPDLATVDYYFVSQTPYFRFITNAWAYDNTMPSPPMPGSPIFSATNTSPLLVTGVGQPITVSGWAKQRILNNYPVQDKYAYLEQYFDKAFVIGANGFLTTNEAGIVSPCGEFFPTTPGLTALVTMPDIDTGERGTGVVHVISLNVDANHDGVMVLLFGGSDQTAPGRPYRFWVNNDWDDQNGLDKNLLNFRNSDDSQINWPRDLEDFARLWICGVPALTNAGYQVTLSWANVTSGSPAINLFRSCETNGGIGYLTDTNVAAAQTVFTYPKGIGLCFGQVRSNTPFVFPANFFTNGADKYFLFEGAGIGQGELVLTISQNGTNLARTSAWFDLCDVNDMFEHAHIEGVMTTFPSMRTNSTSSSTFRVDNYSAASPDEAEQSIVLVHGWNNSYWQAESYAQTMFKRLYWQGYQGRLAALRWPTLSGETDGWLSLLTYNRSEYIAFRSAAGVSAYFDSLRSRSPNYSINAAAHSMGNIVMMEALRLQAVSGSNALNNYLLMEAAVPAHCYDTNAPICPGLFTEDLEHPTPNSYFGYPGAIDDALRGTMVNFFNTNDLALAAWVANQLLNKPEGSLGYYIGPGVQPYLLPSTHLTDPREIMAFTARPRSYAVGAQPGVQGVIGGTEVDLHVQFGFGDTARDHSGQYTRSIQQVRAFYSTFLQRLDESQP